MTNSDDSSGPLYNRFMDTWQHFSTSFDAFYDLLETIAPQAEKLDQQHSETTLALRDTLMDRLSDGDRETVKQDLAKFTGLLEALEEEDKEAHKTLPGSPPANQGRISLSPEGGHILIAIARSVTAGRKVPILLRSLLPTSVGAFEVLIGELIGVYYHELPGLLPVSEREFSLEELRRFASIEEAFDEAVDRRVDTILAGSIEDWSKWFMRKGIEIDLARLSMDWPATLEIFQRRHIIVHNAGRVSKRYVSKLADYFDELPTIGSEVPIDANYVKDSFDNLSVLGYLLIALVERKLMRELGRLHIAGTLSERADYLLKLGRWRAVRHLCHVAKSFKELSSSTRITFQCNEWLAAKQLGGLEEIRADVESWDTSALGHQFHAMKFVLLDDDVQAVQEARNALASGEIRPFELHDSPFFASLREVILSGASEDA